MKRHGRRMVQHMKRNPRQTIERLTRWPVASTRLTTISSTPVDKTCWVSTRENPFLNDEDPGGWGFSSTAGRFITRGRGGVTGGTQPRTRAGSRSAASRRSLTPQYQDLIVTHYFNAEPRPAARPGRFPVLGSSGVLAVLTIAGGAAHLAVFCCVCHCAGCYLCPVAPLDVVPGSHYKEGRRRGRPHLDPSHVRRNKTFPCRPQYILPMFDRRGPPPHESQRGGW